MKHYKLVNNKESMQSVLNIECVLCKVCVSVLCTALCAIAPRSDGPYAFLKTP